MNLTNAAEVWEGVERIGVGAWTPETRRGIGSAIEFQMPGEIAHVGEGGCQVGRNLLLYPEAKRRGVRRLDLRIDGVEARLGDEGLQLAAVRSREQTCLQCNALCGKRRAIAGNARGRKEAGLI